jgi:hypothetical protein
VIGTRLGPYEITAKLGEGGMGEVYRATDTRLRRDVAIKVLPQAFTEDKDRLVRFEREAQVLAQLHHPNIASIFGLEESGGVRALVMELVEGPTLAERIAAGPIAIDDGVAIARQIALALEEAHEKGIVHRDLKPQNVKVDDDNKVKVLDFGLAKAMSAASGISSASALSNSPTLTAAGTMEGVILGTAAYMSPEQAKGKAVDKRADIWAFGVVLYEMLVGRKLFDAETLPETLGAIFRQEIEFETLPPGTPARLRRLVERCLERDPKRRLRDIGEARIALEAIAAGEVEAPAAPAAAGRRGVPLPVVAAALIAAVAVAALVAGRWAKPSPAPPRIASEVTEFSIGVEGLVHMGLSPDGRRLAWMTRGGASLGLAPWTETGKGDSMLKLWVRELDDRVPHEVASDSELRQIIWSPDGSQFAVEIGERLWRIPAAGGERSPICDLPAITGVPGRGVLAGVWLPDDTLLFAAWRGGIYRVPARGGDAEIDVPIDPKVDVDFHRMLLLPDGKSLILAVHRQRDESNTKAPIGIRLELFRDGRRGILPGTEDFVDLAPVGYADGTLLLQAVESEEAQAWGVPFDAQRGIVTGKRFVLIPRVSSVAVGSDGTLAYVPPRARPSVVVRVDRTGAGIATFGEPHPHLDLQALSPDGSRLAVVLNTNELWVRDLRRATLTKLATEEDFIEDPQWTPDGRTIYFSAGNRSRFRRIRADPGAVPETVLDDALRAYLAPDGSGLLLRKGGFHLESEQGFYWAPFDSQGRPGERTKILGGLESIGRLAPGGKLFAYSEGLSGRREAFLTNFPAHDQTIQLSANGGGTPQWSSDGKGVYYLSGGALVEVRVGVDAAGRLTASPERKLFDLERAGLRPEGWSPAPDGNGLLFLKSLATDNRSEIVVVRNGLQRAKATTR